MKILIAHDEEKEFLNLKESIKNSVDLDFDEIDRGINAREVLEYLARSDYDICLLNYSLGETKGIEILRHIRKSGIDTPVIFLIGQENCEMAIEAMKTGANDCLSKTMVTEENLTTSINSSLEFLQNDNRREKNLKKLESDIKQMELILNSTGDGILVIDRNGLITFINPAGSSLLGYVSGELIGMDAYKVLKHGDEEGVPYPRENSPIFQTVMRGLEKIGYGEKYFRKDGSSFYVEYCYKPIIDGSVVVGAVSTFSDITERLNYNESIRKLAFHDSLTGLPNRTLFLDRLNVALAHAQRYKEKLAVLFLDLDDFKPVNDNFGHAMGDLLLKELAQRLRECLREGDTVGRFGGDEFVIILPKIGNTEYAARAGQKVIQSISTPFVIDGNSLKVTASIGFSLYPEHGSDADILLNSADKALYKAKYMGKNKIQTFEGS